MDEKQTKAETETNPETQSTEPETPAPRPSFGDFLTGKFAVPETTDKDTVPEAASETPVDGAGATEGEPEPQAVTADAATDQVETPAEPQNDADTDPETDKPHWAETAYKKERRKRQELEAQLAELTAESEPTVEDEPLDDVTALRNEIRQERMKNSEAIARLRHPDFQEKFDKVMVAAQKDQSIANAVLNSADPAEYAYQLAAHLEIKERYGTTDPVVLMQKAREDALAEAKTETKTNATAALGAVLKKKQQTPTNILAARAATVEDTPSPVRPRSYGDHLRSMRRRLGNG